MLEQAGWYPGRRVPELCLHAGAVYPASVLAILEEFDGLTVGTGGTGHTVSRSIIQFSARTGLDDDNDLELPLYGLGNLHLSGVSADVCLDAAGNLYVVGDMCIWKGRSFAEGLHNILVGYQGWYLEDWHDPMPAIPQWMYRGARISAANVATAPIGPPPPGHPLPKAGN